MKAINTQGDNLMNTSILFFDIEAIANLSSFLSQKGGEDAAA